MPSHNFLLSALEHLQKGEWNLAHQICQENEGDKCFDWIRARLHKDEGDEFNSKYWYGKAQRDHFSTNGDEELALMQSEFSNLVAKGQ